MAEWYKPDASVACRHRYAPVIAYTSQSLVVSRFISMRCFRFRVDPDGPG